MKKPVEDYLALNYRASVYKDEDGDFIIEVDDLPGCVTHGATIAEAFENLEAAKRVWMESRLAAGLEIPEPKQKEEYSGKILVRMPRSLHRALAVQAEQEDVSLNQYLVSLLSMASVWRQSTAINASLGAGNIASHCVHWPGQMVSTPMLDLALLSSTSVIFSDDRNPSQQVLTDWAESLETPAFRLRTAQNKRSALTGGA